MWISAAINVDIHFFFFYDTPTTEIYTLSLHDALPILPVHGKNVFAVRFVIGSTVVRSVFRSEEHTSELQSRLHLVCRLLLEKKKKNIRIRFIDSLVVINETKSALLPIAQINLNYVPTT